MDIIGVPGVAAEAELLAAIVLFHERLGLTAADVVIKVPHPALFSPAESTMQPFMWQHAIVGVAHHILG